MGGQQGFEVQTEWGSHHIKVDVDLGDDQTLEFTTWYGDLTKTTGGAIVTHRKPDGSWCQGSITFDVPISREKAPGRPMWTVESWDPLKLSPSLACHCSDHGFIRQGRWERA